MSIEYIVLILMAMLFLFFLISIIVFSVLIVLDSRKSDTLWIISSAVKNNISLPGLLESQGEAMGSYRGKKLQLLAYHLRHGTPLAIALNEFRNLFSQLGRLAIRIGGETGTLNECLQAAVHYSTLKEVQPDFPKETYTRVRVLFIILFAASIVSSFRIVIPRLSGIFEYYDEGVFSGRAEVYGAVYFYVLTPITGLFVLIFLYNLFPLRRVFDVYLRISWVDNITRGGLRVFRNIRDYFFPNYPRNAKWDVLLFLSVGAQAGKPLTAVLNSLASHHEELNVRKRLRRVLNQVELGQDLWLSLKKHGFLSAGQAAGLLAAEQNGSLSEELTSLIKSREVKGEKAGYLKMELLYLLVSLYVCLVLYFASRFVYESLVLMITSEVFKF